MILLGFLMLLLGLSTMAIFRYDKPDIRIVMLAWIMIMGGGMIMAVGSFQHILMFILI